MIMKKTITFLAAAALAVCALAGYAADITGRVTDGAGEPLMQASVRLLKPDSASWPALPPTSTAVFRFRR